DVGDVKGARLTAALHQQHHWCLAGAPPRLSALVRLGRIERRKLFAIRPPNLAADVRFVSLNRASELGGKGRLSHRPPDAVTHEPCRLVTDLEHALQLKGTHALLAGAKQVEGQ